MADEDMKNSAQGGDAPGAGAPAAVAPAAAPVAATPTAVAPASSGGGGEAHIRIPQKEFAKRVRREAEKLVMDQFGVSLDEAKRIVKTRESSRSEAAPAGSARAPAPAGSRRESLLERQNNELRERNQKLALQNQKVKRKAADQRFDERCRSEALLCGVKADSVRYALDRFADIAATAPDGQDPIAFANAFFSTTLKASEPYLFRDFQAAPPPKEIKVAGATAAAESAAPGGGSPEGARGGAAPAQKNVDDMTDAEFQAYKRINYGSGG